MTSTSDDAGNYISIYGHISATPELFANLFGAHREMQSNQSADAAIFVINPSAGIDGETIAHWRSLDEVQIPRLVIVTVLDGMELDFDDAILLANRVLDPLVTPYLVLHGEDGTPIGAISLEDLTTSDFSTNPPTIGHSDSELTELVAEFREEYLEQMQEMEDGAFAAGILFPALPVNPVNGLGVDYVRKFLAQLPSRN